jgi:glutaconate CoA-transferase subunit B
VSACPYTADEMMTVTAARQLADGAVCFVGIGLPSAACNLARRSVPCGNIIVGDLVGERGRLVARVALSLRVPIGTEVFLSLTGRLDLS